MQLTGYAEAAVTVNPVVPLFVAGTTAPVSTLVQVALLPLIVCSV